MSGRPTQEGILEVKSQKQVTSFYRGSASQLETTGQGRDIPQGAASSSGTNISPEIADAETAYTLPLDQARAVAMLEDLAPPRGYSVKIVDVSRASIVKKLLDTHLSGVDKYPVLVAPAAGKRLEGAEAFKEQQLLDLLPAELPRVRAFTQLKVDPHRVDDVRSALLSYSEVKEVHLITGDWDVYAVLEFPTVAGSSKRLVLDFVLQKVSKIPGVQDVSTMIPEYSMTKFPF